MITVTLVKEGNDLKGFSVKGHAGYADYGSDIVCSAVSALALNCCNSITELTDDKPVIKQNAKNGGFLSLKLTEASKECILLLKSFELGVKSVAEDYGKFIKIAYSDHI